LREGAASVGGLAQTAAEMGMDALALTDHDGMYGVVRFALACKDAGIRPILGTELEWGDGYHVTLLAKNPIGWANLCHLVTDMHLSWGKVAPGKRPRTSFEAIANHSDGVFALSGCTKGEVAWLASLGQMDAARMALRRWLDVFGRDHFAVEIQNHFLEEDPLRNQRLVDLAASFDLRIAATNNVHYLERKDAVVHDVMDCIRRIVALRPATAPRQNSEYWLKPTEQMAALHPESAIAGARWVADQCTYEFELGKFHFPNPTPKGGESSTEALARRCWEGLKRRYPKVSGRIEQRLQMELLMIRRGGFCGYFLLVADIVEHAKKTLGIRCACRGSAAGSLVSFALGISDVDPIRYDLVFERFMNEHRREIPDIDVDFESARRQEVNEYILSTYGARTAMVAMMETFKARAALREVGKVLGIAEAEIDLIAKTFPHISARKIPEALESLPEVAGLKLSASKLEMLFDLAARLDSFPRHLAMHPSGVILSDEKLRDIMPMQRSFEGFLMSQFDKDDVEALGIAKLDVLGVRMFSSITHTLNEIERVHGTKLDLNVGEDKKTFQLIRESRTLGCFQIESPGQRELLGKFQPDRFEELIVDISLFRPGPMKADMVKPFLNRRMGFEPVTYGHPRLAPILKETNGVIVYHEQVMRVLSVLTGCSLGEADKIRRQLDERFAASDKSQELKSSIVERAIKRGWAREAATKIWDEVLAFASFGFCKAHAAAFAVPTYQSAWLKAHYPAEFYCGILTHDPGMYPRRAILSDARSHDVRILGVDVNASWSDYRTEVVNGELGIRLGLQDVKGISLAEINEIISGRKWRSLEDFSRRSRVSQPVTEALVHCGAFDSLKAMRTRRELLWSSGSRSFAAGNSGPRSAGQMTMDLFENQPIRLPGIPEYTDRERVNAELEITGAEATRHIVSFYLKQFESLGWTPAAQLLTKRGGSEVVVAGVKVATQTPPMRSGKRVIFLTLDDGTGQPNIALFDEAQADYARVGFDGWILAVKGKIRRTGVRGVSILATQVLDLGAGPGRKTWHSSGSSAGG